jgi:hypothetical protein
MAPHTHQSHPKASADCTHSKENENQVPLQSSNLANTKRSIVPARRVMPETQSQNLQQGRSRNYIKSDMADSMLSAWETYLCSVYTDLSPK